MRSCHGPFMKWGGTQAGAKRGARAARHNLQTIAQAQCPCNGTCHPAPHTLARSPTGRWDASYNG